MATDNKQPIAPSANEQPTGDAITCNESANLETSVDEKLYIQIYYSLLLALAKHKSKPLIRLYHNAQIQLLDAYLQGYITDYGDVTQLPPERDNEGKQRFLQTRAQLVSNLVARVKEQSERNFKDEPKNRVGHDSSEPEHDELWKMVITPAMIHTYHRLLERYEIAGEVERPDDYPKLWRFLNDIVEAQYDFNAWVHEYQDDSASDSLTLPEKGEKKRKRITGDSGQDTDPASRPRPPAKRKTDSKGDEVQMKTDGEATAKVDDDDDSEEEFQAGLRKDLEHT